MKRSTYVASIALIAIALATGAAVAKSEGRGSPMSFEALDMNSDGQVTKEEMAASRASHFEQADANGDGALSLEELQAKAEERAKSRSERMLERRDANNDGQLTLDEMGDGRRAERRFDRVDRDGDGVISKAEFDEARGKMKRHRDKKEAN